MNLGQIEKLNKKKKLVSRGVSLKVQQEEIYNVFCPSEKHAYILLTNLSLSLSLTNQGTTASLNRFDFAFSP